MKTKNKQKRLLSAVFATLIATLILAALPTEAEAEIYDDTLRLHILANSDSEEDQELKLEIRDRLLSKYGKALKGSHGLDEAKMAVTELIPLMEKDVEEWIKELGFNYSARLTLTEEWYDTRDYEDFSLPKGNYTSLRVLIGDAEGQNWWCVMYPPLCMNIATESAPADDGVIDYTSAEMTLIKGGQYNVKFKILEMFSSIFAKNG